jgi:hypothetical protein
MTRRAINKIQDERLLQMLPGLFIFSVSHIENKLGTPIWGLCLEHITE